MKTTKIISILSILIIFLSIIATLVGLCFNRVYSYPDVISSYGESIELYQIGLYARDSVSMAAQALAQDLITLFLGVPLLIIALYLIHMRKSIRGWFLLSGTLGYFLYTYLSYSVLMTYNHLYLVYVLLTVLSFYAFFLSMAFLHRYQVDELFSEKYPVKALSIFLFIVGLALCMMWLGRILPTITNDNAPYGLEHYSTLVIQSLDLSFIVPACFVSSWLLHRRQAWGYLLSAVLVMKSLTMTTAVSAMAVNMKLHQVEMSFADLIVFPVIVVINFFFLIKMIREIKQVDLKVE